jgi:hypothetical protein
MPAPFSWSLCNLGDDQPGNEKFSIKRVIGRYRVARGFGLSVWQAIRWALPAHWSRPQGWL